MPDFTPVSVIESKLSPNALLLEPRLVYDRALVGFTDEAKDRWPRTPGTTVAVYNIALCLAAIQWWMECSYDAAFEHFSFNVSGAWLGEGTPTFTSSPDLDEEDHCECYP